MFHDEDEGPLPEVRELARETTPPSRLENRIVGELTTRGYLKKRRTSLMAMLAAAASLTTFAIGYTLGTPNDAATNPAKEYALLLYAGPDFLQAPLNDPDRHVRTYGAWGTDLASRGLLDTAGELSDDGWVLRGEQGTATIAPARGVQPEGELTGFFLVRSRDSTQALDIARSHPHLGNHGTIALREVVTRPTSAR